ncbi:MAG: hypothetical protein KJO55_01475 [Gammaproteobacteria bacterium]|nr:hypothetical protein [Gammaproteobacteria bacterium]NND60373.1 hypothetical protein [Gammaproteobacteria bacterium]
MSTDLYSPLLVLAMSLAAAGGLLLITGFLGLAKRHNRITITLVAASITAVMVAVVTHWSVGHASGSADALSVTAFISIHPAPVVVLVIAVVLLGLIRIP